MQSNTAFGSGKSKALDVARRMRSGKHPARPAPEPLDNFITLFKTGNLFDAMVSQCLPAVDMRLEAFLRV